MASRALHHGSRGPESPARTPYPGDKSPGTGPNHPDSLYPENQKWYQSVLLCLHSTKHTGHQTRSTTVAHCPWRGHTAEPRPACAGPGCTSLECGTRIAASTLQWPQGRAAQPTRPAWSSASTGRSGRVAPQVLTVARTIFLAVCTCLSVSIPQTRPWAAVAGTSSRVTLEFSLPSTFPHSKLSQFYCNYFTNVLLYISRVLA